MAGGCWTERGRGGEGARDGRGEPQGGSGGGRVEREREGGKGGKGEMELLFREGWEGAVQGGCQGCQGCQG